MKMGTDKRFSDWRDCTEVDCNECELYYLNQCDGVSEAQNRVCTAFKATRGIVIPEQIKWLKTRLKRLILALAILGVWNAIMTIIILIYYFGIL